MTQETMKQPQEGDNFVLLTSTGERLETKVVSISNGKLWFRDMAGKALQMCLTIVSWRIHWNMKSETWVASTAGNETWIAIQATRTCLYERML